MSWANRLGDLNFEIINELFTEKQLRSLEGPFLPSERSRLENTLRNMMLSYLFENYDWEKQGEDKVVIQGEGPLDLEKVYFDRQIDDSLAEEVEEEIIKEFKKNEDMTDILLSCYKCRKEITKTEFGSSKVAINKKTLVKERYCEDCFDEELRKKKEENGYEWVGIKE